MKTKFLPLFIVLACLAGIHPVAAQGTAFTYQGRLDDNGGPANGLYDLRFTVWDAPTNGNVVAGPVTNSATSVTNGLFLVTLNFGNGVFTGPDRWLQLDVRTNGSGAFTTLFPFQPLLPVPYAITASGASNLLGTLPAAQVTGTIPVAQLPAAVLTNNASGVVLNGIFSGNGAGVTNLNLSALGLGSMISVINQFVLSSSPTAGGHVQWIAEADVNGDGWPDLITANPWSYTLSVLTNNGKGGFALSATLPTIGSAVSVVAVDVNGNGWPDLVSSASSGNQLTVFTNNRAGAFALSSVLPVGTISNNATYCIVSADVNSDGWPDLACVNLNDNTLSVLTNNRSGGFATACTVPVGAEPDWLTMADLNKDGWQEVITANEGDSTITVLTNNRDGSGCFTVSSTMHMTHVPYSVAAADVNGDGWLDLISVSWSDGTVTVLTNNRSGGFGSNAVYSVGNRPYMVATSDVNGDGWPDLVCNSRGDYTLTVLTNKCDGSGGFLLASTIAVGTAPVFVLECDLNKDGLMDLVCADALDGALDVLLQQKIVSFSGNGGGLTNISVNAITGGLTTNMLLGAQTFYFTNGILMKVQ